MKPTYIIPMVAALAGCGGLTYKDYVLPDAKQLIAGKKASIEDTIAVLVYAPNKIYVDKIDSWRSLIRSYKTLREQGVPAGNIFVLYGDGKPEEDGIGVLDNLRDARNFFHKEEYKRPPFGPATKRAFLDTMKALRGGAVDSNDNLIISLNGYGNTKDSKPTFYFVGKKTKEGQPFTGTELVEIVKNAKAGSTLVLIGSAESGAFTHLTYPKGTAIVASVPMGKVSWEGRYVNKSLAKELDFSMTANLLEAFGDSENDVDGSGNLKVGEQFIPGVSLDEAIQRVIFDSMGYESHIKNWIPQDLNFKLPKELLSDEYLRVSAGIDNIDGSKTADKKMRTFLQKNTDLMPRWKTNEFPSTFHPGRGYQPRKKPAKKPAVPVKPTSSP